MQKSQRREKNLASSGGIGFVTPRTELSFYATQQLKCCLIVKREIKKAGGPFVSARKPDVPSLLKDHLFSKSFEIQDLLVTRQRTATFVVNMTCSSNKIKGAISNNKHSQL